MKEIHGNNKIVDVDKPFQSTIKLQREYLKERSSEFSVLVLSFAKVLIYSGKKIVQ